MLNDAEIEEFYQKFTVIREKTYLERYGQYLNKDEQKQVTAQMTNLANTG